MNILVTGANGFIGKNLVRFLRQNTSYTVYEFSRENLLEELDELIYRINIVYHFAGINKKINNNDYLTGNINLTRKLSQIFKKNSNLIIYYASSIQVNKNNEYGNSKKECENILLELEKKSQNKVYILRLPGVFGPGCKPNYNSVVATFCKNTVNKEKLKIIDPEKEIELVFVEDLCEQLICLINSKVVNNRFIKIKNKNRLKIKELESKIKSFQNGLIDLSQFDDLDNKLYKTYLSHKI